MKPRRIAILTTSRADYGLLHWLMRAVDEDPATRLFVIAAGSHLSKAYGRTADEIEADGFKIVARVKTLPFADTPAGVARALGRGATAFAEALIALKPDVLVVLGDRWELLAACSAAVALRIPIAHIHGGESTEGALDEQVRHAVSKLAHLHFTAAEPYRRRLIRMGEDPARVLNVGAPGLESIRRSKPMARGELESRLGFSLKGPLAAVTVHPATLSASRGDGAVDAVLAALDRAGLRAVLTFAGADAGGRAINARLKRYAASRPGRAVAAASLGQRGYIGLLSAADVVVGNSSSGLIEVPALRRPTVNVGDRQKGRLRAPSVIDCPPNAAAVTRALRRALSPAFRRRNCRGLTPYGDGRTAARILGALKRAPLGEALLRKSFHD